MSETARCRDRLSQYIVGDFILDAGAGGSACHPRAITLDMPQPYCPSLEGHPQILQGDYRSMPFICDNSVTALWNSHCIEDWLVPDQINLMKEFRRVLRPGGNLILIAPDEQVYRNVCKTTGQNYNENHKLEFYSLSYFKEHVLPHTGSWEVLYEIPLVDEYSWNCVLRKIA